MASISDLPLTKFYCSTALFYSLVPIIILACLYGVVARASPSRFSPKEWRAYHWPIVGSALYFYSKRRDMLEQGTNCSSNGNFSFYVGRKHIVSLSGLAGRKAFYESKDLNFPAGFVELLAGIPSLGEPAKEQSWARYFNKVILTMTHRDNLTLKICSWSSDIRALCDELAARLPEKKTEWHVFNPFDDVYELVYKLTTRFVGSDDVAEDRECLRWSLSIFERFEKSSSTAGFIFPWLITPAHAVRAFLGIRLGLGLAGIIKKRKQSGIRKDDALHYFLDRDTSSAEIIKFQISALWAGLLTTGSIGSWMPILLASKPIWKERCNQEVASVIAKHRTNHSQTPMDILNSLDLEAWESGFPVLHGCVRESVRLCMPGTVFRKNTSGSDIPIGDTGEVIPNGSFAAFLIDNVQMDPKLYPEPLAFNPGRYLGENTGQKNEPHTFVGWGSGCHPCVGAKVARLEITMIMAYFLIYFEFELSNEQNKPVSGPSRLPDRNGHKAQKEDEPIYVRYRLNTWR